MNHLKLLGVGMLLLQCLIYGLPDSYVKIIYREFPVMSFLGCRYAVASSVLLAIWGKTIIQEIRTTNYKHYIIPVLCTGSAFLISNYSLKFATVSNAAFVRSATPLLAAILLMLFFKRRFTLRDALVLSIMMTGMYFLATQQGLSFSQGFGIGECLSLLAAADMAGSLVFGKDALNYIKPITLTFLQCIASLVFCGLVGLADGTLLHTPWELMQEPFVFLCMLYLAVFCSVGGLILQNLALTYINSKMCSVVQCMYPIIASIVAYFVLGEHMGYIGILGCSMVITAVILECFSRE